jgi:hypothetical protein
MLNKTVREGESRSANFVKITGKMPLGAQALLALS